MSTYILTSLFHADFSSEVATVFSNVIRRRNNFVFIASDFDAPDEKTDGYFCEMVRKFEIIGLNFKNNTVIDGRVTPIRAQQLIREADVLWLSGGPTTTQFACLQNYELIDLIAAHKGVVIGMSAGAINMAEAAIDTPSPRHEETFIYSGIGCVPFSVEPHFDVDNISDELMELSEKYDIYGLCDEAMILFHNGEFTFCGEVFHLEGGKVICVSR